MIAISKTCLKSLQNKNIWILTEEKLCDHVAAVSSLMDRLLDLSKNSLQYGNSMCPSMIRKLKVIVYFRKVFLLSKFKYFCFVILMRKVPSITGYESPSELLGAQTYDTALYVLLHFFFVFSLENFLWSAKTMKNVI
jgi:hypothetical protein